ncbi:hypothetical protein H9X99_14430 [Intestinimonas butyriciproducens]|nr:hypothetical protein [Intestinimonas butyriciproducens]
MLDAYAGFLDRLTGMLQNAVFRPKREICALKKLARTAILTVLANFFFGLIFQNPILQQARSTVLGILFPACATLLTVLQ